MTTREEFDKAIADFHKADTIEKTAKSLRASAREVILDYWRINMDEFTPTGEGKTMVGRASDGPGVSITVPVTEGTPAHFDDERAVECYREFEDISPEMADALFIRMPVFVGPEMVVHTAKERPDWATTIASVLLKYTVPATDNVPGSPRVAPVKGKRKAETEV